MASQGGGSGLSKTDILKLIFGEVATGYPTTDGIGVLAMDSFTNPSQASSSGAND